MWQDTGVDKKELARIWESICTNMAIRNAQLDPVHPIIEPCPDPDSLPFDTLGAEVRGVWVDPEEYPVGTWFYWGEDRVSVRLAGEDQIARVEYRQ